MIGLSYPSSGRGGVLRHILFLQPNKWASTSCSQSKTKFLFQSGWVHSKKLMLLTCLVAGIGMCWNGLATSLSVHVLRYVFSASEQINPSHPLAQSGDLEVSRTVAASLYFGAVRAPEPDGLAFQRKRARGAPRAARPHRPAPDADGVRAVIGRRGRCSVVQVLRKVLSRREFVDSPSAGAYRRQTL